MTYSAMRPQRGVLALSGYGLRIAVERGHLTVEDGAGRSRRRGRFSRVTPELRRLVIHGSSGTVSLDALRWLQDTGAHVVQLDRDGQLVTVTATARLDDARLRRAQALALTSGLAVELAREVIAAKIAGQASVLDEIPGAAPIAEALRESVAHVECAATLDRVRYVEARAAYAYWHAWRAVELRFPAKQLAKVPEHWRRVGDRHSPRTGRPQRGVSPLNAILNYVYSIAAAEARIAVIEAGCDPGLGILHLDREARASFALDVLEPVRPDVDAYVLQLARDRTFTRDDFFETRDGVCRLMPPLTHELSESAGRWAKRLKPVAQRVARSFERTAAVRTPPAEAPGERDEPLSRLPALLRARRTLAEPLTQGPAASTRRCRRCGAAVETRRRVYCGKCIDTLPQMASTYALASLRRRQREESGAGPSDATRQLLAGARSQRAAEIRAWEAAHPVIPSPHVFASDILPALAKVRAQDVRDVTGLSISYCRRVLRGKFVPHPMHWDPLRRLARDNPRRNAAK